MEVIRNAKTMYYMGSRDENRKCPKKILAYCETVVGGLDRITCFVDNVPATGAVEACNLAVLSAELMGMLVG